MHRERRIYEVYLLDDATYALHFYIMLNSCNNDAIYVIGIVSGIEWYCVLYCMIVTMQSM